MPVLTAVRPPKTHKFTATDYYRMAETGIIRPKERVELFDGEIIDMSPIGPFHGGVVGRLIRLFAEVAKGRWFLWAQCSMRLDDFSVPEPDLMLLKPSPKDYTDKLPTPQDVLLLVEVSDSSLEYDRGRKSRAYARAGIPEVWIVNLSDLLVEVCRDPSSEGYKSVITLRPGEKASPLAFADVVVDITGLLK